jgi:hypothetical protein
VQSRSDQPDEGATPQWTRTFNSLADAQRFEEQFRTDLSQRNLGFVGTLPTLVDADGREFYVGNLAQSCAAAPKPEWRRIIREFLDSFQSVGSFVAISPDVAAMSLRLRLYDLSADGADTTSDSATAVQVMRAAVHWPALPQLHWVLFVRRGGASQNVLPEHLEAWGITVDNAWDLARKNTLRHDVGELIKYLDMAAYSGDSMFTTTGVLQSHRWLSDTPYGLFISTPNRHHVLCRRVDTEGVWLLSNFFQMTLDLYETGPYPLSTNVWWVPAAGPGEHGERAELIELVPEGINEDGATTFSLNPGPQLLEELDTLARDTGLQ